ncbi:molybdenum cofactor biosynthesis protein B [Methanomicrobiaceae archaeon CYW5]|uniref:MogA/MoaB family molybdenum cofactor biosynthesis protein n=1 Tax=Methanovulcanius yangii TaxID=1789227 RepID=UPI0029CA7689|nr:MogA/MoaB family molybdenum cofactor biosynthesis protein [Methanovulcanius yangii]MBT8508438.1 molybdenum cofactor biosynthesis protein B [Methanovulcanius yangii]
MDPSHIQDITLTAAVITVSTSRDVATDGSGALIKERFAASGIPIGYYAVVPDDIRAIRQALTTAFSASCNVVVVNGGTGITHDDCTIEAVAPLFEKTIDGFGELFRLLSYEEVGTRMVLSRAIAGIIDKKAVFCTPGSTAAVRLAMDAIILPEARHIITHASK